MKKSFRFVALVLVLLVWTTRSWAGPLSAYWSTVKGTVWIVSKSGKGTGALIDRKRRLVVTNKHVVGSASHVVVFFPAYNSKRQLYINRSVYLSSSNRQALIRSGKLVVGRVIAFSSRTDLALLQLSSVPADARVLPLAATSAQPNDEVHVVGHPADRPLWRYALGKVDHVRHKSWSYRDGQYVSTQAVTFYSNIWGGNSGGPLVNNRGELVGVVAATSRSNPMIATAIDVTSVHALLKTLRWYAVVAISNPTSVTVPFQFRWRPSDPWKTYFLKPGHVYWFTTTRVIGETPKPDIRFDNSYDDGFQEKVYRLRYYAVLRGYKPSHTDGRKYVFRAKSYGYDLFRKS